MDDMMIWAWSEAIDPYNISGTFRRNVPIQVGHDIEISENFGIFSSKFSSWLLEPKSDIVKKNYIQNVSLW